MALTRSQSKRKRTAAEADSVGLNKNIADLPDYTLTCVAEYLPKTSAALFATVFSITDYSSPPSATTETIISSYTCENAKDPWEEIDFMDIDMSLREKLTDEDIANLLKCIDEAKLKRLKLTNCFQVTGRCLEPLENFFVLEQLDLSLVRKRQNPDNALSISLSEQVVLPILESIIEDECSLLQHVQFPQQWRYNQSQEFHTFLVKYDNFLRSRGLCYSCYEIIGREEMLDKERKKSYGLQELTCYHCMKTACRSCVDHGFIDVDSCNQCQKVYCSDCFSIEYCHMCDEQSCSACSMINYCAGCDTHFCDYCGHGNESDSDY